MHSNIEIHKFNFNILFLNHSIIEALLETSIMTNVNSLHHITRLLAEELHQHRTIASKYY